MTVTDFVAVLGPLFTALVAYLAARWRYSGRVDQTDARELWNASRALRSDLEEQIGRLSASLESKDLRITQLDRRIDELREENATLREEIVEKNDEIKLLTGRVYYLEQELLRVRTREARVAQVLSEEESA